MKILSLLTILVLTLSSCNPFSLGEFSEEKDRGKKDRAVGRDNFKAPDLSEIGEKIEEIKVEVVEKKETCSNYINSARSLLTLKYIQGLQNCLSKMIDDQLEPLCEQEREIKEAIAFYEDERSDEADDIIEELEAVQDDLEYQKEDLVYYFEDLADRVESFEDRAEDKFGAERRRTNGIIKQFGIEIIEMGTVHSISGFTNTIRRKTRLACPGQIDWDKIREKQKRK